jgi:pyruvate formate lyase activating enzyme
MTPRALVDAAKRERSFGIAYTYSEPAVHAEYVLDTAALARAEGLKNVLVTNGFLQEEPAAQVLALTDAANVDLKGFTDSFYREATGGRLKDVQRFISQAAGVTHLEVTTLVIPGKNDSPAEIEALAAWLASLRKDIPLHLSAYHPEYKYTVPTTSADSLRELAVLARRHLTWVYVGNVSPEVSQTICTSCGNVLVNRKGWQVQTSGLRGTVCAKCGTPSPIVIS